MRKSYIFFVVIILLLAAGWGLYVYNKPHTSTKNINADVTIAATDLYNQYLQNEAAANQKYLGKVIEVTGTVNETQKSDSTFSILLNAGQEMGGINCNLSIADNKDVSMPKPGAVLTVKGKCSGFLIDVNLTDCVLKK